MVKDTHVLYRFFDADDALLYVGITNNPRTRFKGHQKEKAWFNKVTRSTMEHFASRRELCAAEIAAIQDEQPKYNIAYATTGEPVERPETISLRSINSYGRRVHADANYFPAPDAIVDEPPQLWRERYPCLVCVKFGVVREVDDLSIPLNDTVRCVACRTEWTSDEWVRAIVEKYRSTA